MRCCAEPTDRPSRLTNNGIYTGWLIIISYFITVTWTGSAKRCGGRSKLISGKCGRTQVEWHDSTCAGQRKKNKLVKEFHLIINGVGQVIQRSIDAGVGFVVAASRRVNVKYWTCVVATRGHGKGATASGIPGISFIITDPTTNLAMYTDNFVSYYFLPFRSWHSTFHTIYIS